MQSATLLFPNFACVVRANKQTNQPPRLARTSALVFNAPLPPLSVPLPSFDYGTVYSSSVTSVSCASTYVYLQGTILIAVNPLRPIPDPSADEYVDRPLNPETPHPYAIAEVRIQLHTSAVSARAVFICFVLVHGSCSWVQFMVHGLWVHGYVVYVHGSWVDDSC